MLRALIRERAGETAGSFMAPMFAVGSYLRGARFFHPQGVCYRARVEPADCEARLAPLAERLRGPAFVRLSAALWRRESELPDVLGFAVRFRPGNSGPVVSEQAADDDQDLLFATIWRPWTTPIGPLTTDAHDFADNLYYAVSPFDARGIGVLRLRLRPGYDGGDTGDRKEEPDEMPTIRHASPLPDRRYADLDDAVRDGRAVFHVDARFSRRPLTGWQPLVRIVLEEAVPIDQQALRFSPFRAGRGLRPRGFIHALRKPVYPLSQVARSARRAGSTDSR